MEYPVHRRGKTRLAGMAAGNPVLRAQLRAIQDRVPGTSLAFRPDSAPYIRRQMTHDGAAGSSFGIAIPMPKASIPTNLLFPMREWRNWQTHQT